MRTKLNYVEIVFMLIAAIYFAQNISNITHYMFVLLLSAVLTITVISAIFHVLPIKLKDAIINHLNELR